MALVRTRLVAATGLVAASILAPAPAVAAGTPAARVAVPCRPGSAEHTAATKELAAIDESVRRLAPGTSAEPVAEALARLAKGPCFALAREARAGVPTPRDALVLSTWWAAGGHAWLRSYLEADERLRLRHVVLPPDVPRVIDAASAGPALAALVCPASDTTCGAEARGFRRRAEMFFAKTSVSYTDPCQPTPATPAWCAKAAGARDYKGWRTCLEDEVPRRPVLPLGDLRSPRGGWLLTTRAQWQPLDAPRSCPKAYAFEVDSGITYRAELCPGKPVEAMATGRVPSHLVREALWMLLLEQDVRFARPGAEEVRVPPGLTPKWPLPAPQVDDSEPGVPGGCAVAVTHDTELAWRWLAPDKAAGATRLLSSPGGRYADALLDVMLASLEASPSAQPPPAEVARALEALRR